MMNHIKNLNQSVNMSKEDIIINNTLIKNFMEVDVFEYDEWKVAQLTEGYYHLSYSWLMPVIEKIESLPNIDDPNNSKYKFIKTTYSVDIFEYIKLDPEINWFKFEYKRIYDYTNKCDISIFTENINLISAVWQLCIKFIKYYNQNK